MSKFDLDLLNERSFANLCSVISLTSVTSLQSVIKKDKFLPNRHFFRGNFKGSIRLKFAFINIVWSYHLQANLQEYRQIDLESKAPLDS